jgi:hypothetical protein
LSPNGFDLQNSNEWSLLRGRRINETCIVCQVRPKQSAEYTFQLLLATSPKKGKVRLLRLAVNIHFYFLIPSGKPRNDESPNGFDLQNNNEWSSLRGRGINETCIVSKVRPKQFPFIANAHTLTLRLIIL